MNNLRQRYIEYILILKEHIQQLIGINYPKEIIKLIVVFAYKPAKIVCGLHRTFLISDKIYVWGRNDHGQLGLGHKNDIIHPEELSLRTNIESISCGNSHTVALTSIPNKLYVWGANKDGQLGLGHTINKKSPQKLIFHEPIVSVSCGGYHTIALTSILVKIYVWGNNMFGQLGLGDYKFKNLPHKIIFRKPIISISCGTYHNVMLTQNSNSSNRIYVWGFNENGQLGLGDCEDRIIPHKLSLYKVISVCCGGNHTIALTNDGKIYTWGHNGYGDSGMGCDKNMSSPQKISFRESIVSASCNEFYKIFLTKNNKIIIWDNYKREIEYTYGQRTNYKKKYDLSQELISIDCARDHAVVLTKSEKIYVRGSNEYGQLGLGDTDDKKLLTEFNFICEEPHQISQSRKNYIYYIFVLKEYLINTIGIYCPIEIIAYIIVSIYKPIQISCGVCHTILFDDNNDIYAWGYNQYEQLGSENEIEYLSPKKIKIPEDIISICCGIDHDVALTYIPNKIYVWGKNDHGQLGLGDKKNRTTPHEILLSITIKSIYCGGHYTIVLTNISNQMYVWGENKTGQLGLKHNMDVYFPTKFIFCLPIVSVSCGGYHTGILTKNSYHLNEIYMWGWNVQGQLGLGDTHDRNVPCKLDLHKQIISLNCGICHTIILISNNEIYVWGMNLCGELGLGHTEDVNLPQKLIINEMIASIHCGNYFTIALTKSGNYYSWGWFDPIEKGFISDVPEYFIQKDPIISVNCGYDHVVVVSKSGKIYAWGNNRFGQLGLGHTENKILPQLIKFKF